MPCSMEHEQMKNIVYSTQFCKIIVPQAQIFNINTNFPDEEINCSFLGRKTSVW